MYNFKWKIAAKSLYTACNVFILYFHLNHAHSYPNQEVRNAAVLCVLK